MGKYTSHHLFQYGGLLLHEFNDWFHIGQYIRYGLRTTDYGLGVKHGLRYKTRTG